MVVGDTGGCGPPDYPPPHTHFNHQTHPHHPPHPYATDHGHAPHGHAHHHHMGQPHPDHQPHGVSSRVVAMHGVMGVHQGGQPHMVTSRISSGCGLGVGLAQGGQPNGGWGVGGIERGNMDTPPPLGGGSSSSLESSYCLGLVSSSKFYRKMAPRV